MVKKLAFILSLLGAAAVSITRLIAQGAPASSFATIRNDFFVLDQDGGRVQTRSGCLRQFNGLYYWYGGTNRFRDQTCYSSPDLVHWTNQGIVLHLDVDANRIDVLYNESTKQYVMFLKYNGNGAHFGIATASSPAGPFTFKSQTLVDNALIGDMSMFQDSDGKAYLCYVSWAKGTNAQHGIYLMSPDYLTLDHRVYLWDTGGREAPHMFKRGEYYYYGTSRTAWIDSTATNYYRAKNLAGPWSPAKVMDTPGSTNSWDCQADFVYPFQGSHGTVYMFAGDRWVKNGGRQGDYVWLPMEFDGDGNPVVNYYQDWELDARDGTWRRFDRSRDLASGKAVTASSVSGSNAAANVTAQTDAGDYADRKWESEPSDAQWIMVDLGAPAKIDRVILKWGNTCAKSFKIETSGDAKSWSDVYGTTQGGSYSVTDVSFKNAVARYVRVDATQRGFAPPVRRRRFGGGNNASPQPSASPSPAPNVQPGGYDLFSFQVLDD